MITIDKSRYYKEAYFRCCEIPMMAFFAKIETECRSPFSQKAPSQILRSSRQVFCKKGVLRNSQNSHENTCGRVSF